MPATKNGNILETDEWTITWSDSETLDLKNKGNKKHTVLCGDPHIVTDGEPEMDFPSPTCSFVLTDGTFIVADAPAANQPMNDVHVFTDDGQHVAFGKASEFDDHVGTIFIQQDDGSFYAAISRDVGTTNPNPVPKKYRDIN